MDLRESKVHSFIVKLWPEDAGDETQKAVWHGYITHVPGGERRYLKGMSDITDFIKRYLSNGIESSRESWPKRWLKRLQGQRRDP